MVVAADEAERPTKKPRHSRSLPSIKSPLPSSSSFLPRTSSSHTLIPRRPQAGRSIAPNPLRPFVAAADRLSMWESPYSLAFKKDLYSSLPTHIADAALHTVNAAYAPNTMSSYAAGLLRFTQFCDEINIPEADRMPASFCSWLASYPSMLAPSQAVLSKDGCRASKPGTISTTLLGTA